MRGKGRQPGPSKMGEAAAAAAMAGPGQKRRRGREGRSGGRCETEAAAMAAGGELGVAIVKVRLESGERRSPLLWGGLATS